MKFPEGNAAWTVDITYPKTSQDNTLAPAASGQKPADTRKAQRIEVTQADNIRRIRTIWNIGAPTEEWTIPNQPVIFKEYRNGIVFSIPKGGVEAVSDNFNMPNDLSSFDWVTPATRKEKEPVNYQGKPCFHYQGTVRTPWPKAPLEKREAWIDSTTLFPLSFETERIHCVFTLSRPPDGPLVVPEKFKKEIADYKHVMGYP